MKKIRMKSIRKRLYLGLGFMYIISFLVYGISHSRNNSNYENSNNIIMEDIKLINKLDSLDNRICIIEKDLVGNECLENNCLERNAEMLMKIMIESDSMGLSIINSKNNKRVDWFHLDDSITIEKNKSNLFLAIWEVKESVSKKRKILSESIKLKADEIKKGALLILNIEKYIVIAALTLMTIILLFLPMIIINPVDYLTGRAMEMYKKSFKKEFDVTKKDETEIIEQIVNEFGYEIERLKSVEGNEN